MASTPLLSSCLWESRWGPSAAAAAVLSAATATAGTAPSVRGGDLQAGLDTQLLEEQVASLVDVHGFTVVVASGNTRSDACSTAPASVPQTITVAGANLDSKFEDQPSSVGLLSHSAAELAEHSVPAPPLTSPRVLP